MTIEAKPRPDRQDKGKQTNKKNRVDILESQISGAEQLTHTEVATFEEGCDVPGRDPSLLHELSQRNLQEEDRDASDEHKQQVGDQEGPCNRPIIHMVTIITRPSHTLILFQK